MTPLQVGGDALTGNSGNDSITGGLAADTINVGGGINTVVFTSGLTIDTISGYTGDDIGAFDLSELEADDAVEDGETIDFVNGSSSSMLDGAVIEIQSISGAGPTTLGSSTNVIHYTSPVARPQP